jgi:hypothetical protein
MKSYIKAGLAALVVAAIGITHAGRDGSGNYSLPAGNPVTTGTTISSTWANNTLSDIASALTQSLSKDGQTVPTANLPMGSFKHTNVADATSRNQYAAAGQVQDGELWTLGGVSGTNTITGSLTPAITSYVDGMIVTFEPAATNTGAATLSINGLSALSIVKADGDALIAGDLVSGVPAVVVRDETQFVLLNPQASVNGIATSDLARLSQSNTFTQNQTMSKADPRLCFYDSDGDASMFWRWFSDTARLHIVDGSTCTTTGASSPIRIDSAAGTATLLQLAATTVQINGGTAWHSGNDGDGSGLDADTLAGLSDTAYAKLAASNTFTASPGIESPAPSITLNETGVTAENGRWRWVADAENLHLQTRTDDNATGSNVIVVGRTGTTVDSLDLTATTVTVNGQDVRNTALFTAGTLAVARGGTGTTSSTGTGSVVLSASPTFTGTVSGAAASFSGTVTANAFSGAGSSLTALNASNLSSGTVPSARISSASVTQHMDDGDARNITGKAGTAKTLSTSAPTGGSDGDIWYRY